MWKEANDRRVAEERLAQELELQGRDQRRNNLGSELSPDYYDSCNQRQQREPSKKSNRRPNSGVEHYEPYHDDRRRQKVMSGVDHYPSFEEIMEHERQAPRGKNDRYDRSKDNPKRRPNSGVEHYAPMEVVDEYERPNPLALDSNYVMAGVMEHECQAPRGKNERYDRTKDNPKRRPNSGVEHYAPMDVVDEHERPNPLALDSKYSTALEQLEGQAGSKSKRSRNHGHQPDTARGRQVDPCSSDGEFTRPKDSGPPTRRGDSKASRRPSGREAAGQRRLC